MQQPSKLKLRIAGIYCTIPKEVQRNLESPFLKIMFFVVYEVTLSL